MKSLPALLAIGLLTLWASACGDSGKGGSSKLASSSSATATNAANTTSTPDLTKIDGDRDNDVGAPDDDTNNDAVLNFGREAGPTDQQAVTALLERYYTAALAGDGAGACSMIYSTLSESVAEDYGTSYGQASAGPSYLRAGKTCPQVMALLFKHFHTQLALELPKLQVSRVRLNGHRGLAVLSFGSLPERQISVAREGHNWRVEALFDSELP
jgi:hypothetical protein